MPFVGRPAAAATKRRRRYMEILLAVTQCVRPKLKRTIPSSSSPVAADHRQGQKVNERRQLPWKRFSVHFLLFTQMKKRKLIERHDSVD
jgi:hypothetical protein